MVVSNINDPLASPPPARGGPRLEFFLGLVAKTFFVKKPDYRFLISNPQFLIPVFRRFISALLIFSLLAPDVAKCSDVLFDEGSLSVVTSILHASDKSVRDKQTSRGLGLMPQTAAASNSAFTQDLLPSRQGYSSTLPKSASSSNKGSGSSSRQSPNPPSPPSQGSNKGSPEQRHSPPKVTSQRVKDTPRGAEIIVLSSAPDKVVSATSPLSSPAQKAQARAALSDPEEHSFDVRTPEPPGVFQRLFGTTAKDQQRQIARGNKELGERLLDQEFMLSEADDGDEQLSITIESGKQKPKKKKRSRHDDDEDTEQARGDLREDLNLEAVDAGENGQAGESKAKGEGRAGRHLHAKQANRGMVAPADGQDYDRAISPTDSTSSDDDEDLEAGGKRTPPTPDPDEEAKAAKAKQTREALAYIRNQILMRRLLITMLVIGIFNACGDYPETLIFEEGTKTFNNYDGELLTTESPSPTYSAMVFGIMLATRWLFLSLPSHLTFAKQRVQASYKSFFLEEAPEDQAAYNGEKRKIWSISFLNVLMPCYLLWQALNPRGEKLEHPLVDQLLFAFSVFPLITDGAFSTAMPLLQLTDDTHYKKLLDRLDASSPIEQTRSRWEKEFGKLVRAASQLSEEKVNTLYALGQSMPLALVPAEKDSEQKEPEEYQESQDLKIQKHTLTLMKASLTVAEEEDAAGRVPAFKDQFFFGKSKEELAEKGALWWARTAMLGKSYISGWIITQMLSYITDISWLIGIPAVIGGALWGYNVVYANVPKAKALLFRVMGGTDERDSQNHPWIRKGLTVGAIVQGLFYTLPLTVLACVATANWSTHWLAQTARGVILAFPISLYAANRIVDSTRAIQKVVSSGPRFSAYLGYPSDDYKREEVRRIAGELQDLAKNLHPTVIEEISQGMEALPPSPPLPATPAKPGYFQRTLRALNPLGWAWITNCRKESSVLARDESVQEGAS